MSPDSAWLLHRNTSPLLSHVILQPLTDLQWEPDESPEPVSLLHSLTFFYNVVCVCVGVFHQVCHTPLWISQPWTSLNHHWSRIATPRTSVAYLFMDILIHVWQKAIAYEHMFKCSSQCKQFDFLSGNFRLFVKEAKKLISHDFMCNELFPYVDVSVQVKNYPNWGQIKTKSGHDWVNMPENMQAISSLDRIHKKTKWSFCFIHFFCLHVSPYVSTFCHRPNTMWSFVEASGFHVLSSYRNQHWVHCT